MITTLIILSGLLGLLVGSFLNVVILRFGTGLPISKGRSMCPSCGKTLRWYELVPVFSFIFQRGKCTECSSPISWQYPIVELDTAVLFACVTIRQYALYPVYSSFSHGLLFSALFVVYYWIIVSLLVVIAVYDFRHKIIPNKLVYTFILLSLAKLALFFYCLKVNPFAFPYIYDVLAPFILFLPFWFLWKVSDGRWIGFGDGKLAFGIGALLGFIGGISAIILGFWIGAAFCLIALALQQLLPRMTAKLAWGSEVPLAPFLIIGAFIVLFSHPDVLSLSHFFSAYALP
jgi:prepilin signal peptidase PulO-like enzyme (type II secretory pathway)